MECHPALWEDMHATSMLWPLMARIFPSRSRYASVMLTFAELVQWPASVTQGAYAAAPRGNSLGGLRGLTPCSFHLSEEMKASGGQISCLFSLDFCLWLWLRTCVASCKESRGGGEQDALCCQKKCEAKAPGHCLLSGLGQRRPFLWRQGERWSPEWEHFWDW